MFKSKLQPFGLTPIQALVLHALYGEEGLSAGELGKRLVLDSATLSGVLDRMADGGWIVKSAAKEDRRVLNIQLTEKSHSFRDNFLKEIMNVNHEVLSIFNTEERLLLIRMLKDLRK
ncbi:MAG: MarR family transcriptional regulator [Syntrophaceae bacterium]|nr:MarR family transcriptional regulator [Syntrophaceae bacterium]